jgi:hypothetical protein
MRWPLGCMAGLGKRSEHERDLKKERHTTKTREWNGFPAVVFTGACGKGKGSLG